MKKTVKKHIAVVILILINVTTGILLLKNRSFSHLAIWNIRESDKEKDFYWKPEDAPRYFRFEPSNDRPSIFRNEAFPLVKDENDELKIVLKLARYVMDIGLDKIQPYLSLRWDSPEGMLRQIRAGAGAHCFHRCIVFSSYLSSLGIKSRLWALENDNFNAVPHTVTEVYLKSLGKWVFIDVMWKLYVTENGKPVSFLELRERLLNRDNEKILAHNINNELIYEKEKLYPYNRLIKCVFLRANNDFVNRYSSRYGALSIFKNPIDKLPGDIRIGLEYLFGGGDVFLYYLDKFSRSLKSKIIIIKLLFYFFIFSLVATGILLLMLSLFLLKRCLAINLSKKETRHR